MEDEVRSITVIVDSFWLLRAITTTISEIVIAIITVLSIILCAEVTPVITSVCDIGCTLRSILLAVSTVTCVVICTILAPYLSVYLSVVVVRCACFIAPFTYSYAIRADLLVWLYLEYIIRCSGSITDRALYTFFVFFHNLTCLFV
jgi:hypothetical protein